MLLIVHGREGLFIHCTTADPISLKVLDAGLNFGAFALFTASLKCEVWAFEMQPHIFTAVDMAMRLSGYRYLLTSLIKE